jgi:hypothetical protein
MLHLTLQLSPNQQIRYASLRTRYISKIIATRKIQSKYNRQFPCHSLYYY